MEISYLDQGERILAMGTFATTNPRTRPDKSLGDGLKSNFDGRTIIANPMENKSESTWNL